MGTVVNQIYTGAIDGRIDLEKLKKQSGDIAKLYPCRPRMLRYRQENITILIFNTGKVRFMGRPCEEYELELLFNDLTGLVVKNIKKVSETIVLQLDNISTPINLHAIAVKHPDKFTFEPEIFIGLHLTCIKDVHVNIFSSGKVVLLGKQAIESISEVLRLCKCFLK